MPTTISLCMIVKNEEKHIEKCLSSAMPLVDEVIIVDTGSTDNTMEIIQSFQIDFPDNNIHLIESVWENDFAKARNLSLKDASSDWILILDADEIMECNSVLLKKYIEQIDQDVFIVPILNYSSEGAPVLSTVMPRLFKNKNIKYEGSIHEHLVKDGKDPASVVLDGNLALIHHVGYMQDVIKEKNKAKRNLKIIRKQIQQEPTVAFHRYNLGKTYMQQGDYKKAMEAFVKWSNCERSSFMEEMDAGYSVAICLIKLKKYKDADDYLSKLEHNPIFENQAKLYNLWAEVYEEQKKYKQAFEAHHRALVCGLMGMDKSGVEDIGVGGYYTILLMGLIYSELGDDRAIHYFINGIYNRDNQYLIGKQQFLEFVQDFRDGLYIENVKNFNEAIATISNRDYLVVDEKNTDSELVQNQQSILETINKSVENGDLQTAKSIIEECENILGNYPAIYGAKGVIAMIEQDMIQASLYFVLAERYFPNDFDAIYNLAFLYENIEIPEMAAIYYYKASRHEKCPLSELELMHEKVEEYRDKFDWFVVD